MFSSSSAKRNKQYIRFVIVLIVILFGTAALQTIPLHAQTPNPIVQISAVAPGLLTWSSDGRYLAWAEITGLQSLAYYVDYPKWKLYDVQTGQISSSSGYPFLPHFTSEESAAFSQEAPSAATGDEHPKIIFVSPNNRYLIYAGNRHVVQGHSSWKLMLGDRQTLQVFPTSLELDVSSHLLKMQVEWSQDSHVFALTQQYDTVLTKTGIAPSLYVTDYADNLANYTNQSQFAEPVVAGKRYISDRVWNLSADGRYALITGTEKQVIFEAQLIIYDGRDSSRSQILTDIDAGIITDAHFLANDVNHILMMTTQGLMLYDVQAQHKVLLNASFNSKDFPGRLSPNNEWVAYLTESKLYIAQIKYLDLAGSLATLTAPATTH